MDLNEKVAAASGLNNVGGRCIVGIRHRPLRKWRDGRSEIKLRRGLRERPIGQTVNGERNGERSCLNACRVALEYLQLRIHSGLKCDRRQEATILDALESETPTAEAGRPATR